MLTEEKTKAVAELAAVLAEVPAHRLEFAKSLIHQYETKEFLSIQQMLWVLAITKETQP